MTWNGVDSAVVERIASEHGHEAHGALINGDALLFAFLIAGVIGGFAAGYYYRALMENKKS